MSVLTPFHFLIGDNIIQSVQKCYLEVPNNKLSRWQHLQKVRQDFWLRWQKEYLAELQRRHKWTKADKNMQEVHFKRRSLATSTMGNWKGY